MSVTGVTGAELRELRQRAGLSLRDCAALFTAMGLTCTLGQIGNVEHGRRTGPPGFMERAASILHFHGGPQVLGPTGHVRILPDDEAKDYLRQLRDDGWDPRAGDTADDLDDLDAEAERSEGRWALTDRKVR